MLSDKMPTAMMARRNSSIHKPVTDVEIPKLNLPNVYEVLRLVGEGTFGQVHLAIHRQTGDMVALKSVSAETTRTQDFLKEVHYSYFLSPHQSILKAYDVAFEADDRYWFAQEYCPYGDLSAYMKEGSGMDEHLVKSIAAQLASALEFIHSKDLVHRDVQAANVLVFQKDLSRVKLADFGLTRKTSTLVKKTNVSMPFMPPEICDAVYNEGYHADPSSDVWQLAMLVLNLLTGSTPWVQADITDSNYNEFLNWHKRKTTKTPRKFRQYSERFVRMLRRMLDPKPSKRSTVKEVFKYVEDRWMARSASISYIERRPSKAGDLGNNNNELLVPPAREHAGRLSLGNLLMSFGVEGNVDRDVKRKRIQDWIQKTSTP